jgi:hypothetical protein
MDSPRDSVSKREDEAIKIAADISMKPKTQWHHLLFRKAQRAAEKGFDSGFQAAIELLKSQEAYKYEYVNQTEAYDMGLGLSPTQWADYLESQKGKL